MTSSTARVSGEVGQIFMSRGISLKEKCVRKDPPVLERVYVSSSWQFAVLRQLFNAYYATTR